MRFKSVRDRPTEIKGERMKMSEDTIKSPVFVNHPKPDYLEDAIAWQCKRCGKWDYIDKDHGKEIAQDGRRRMRLQICNGCFLGYAFDKMTGIPTKLGQQPPIHDFHRISMAKNLESEQNAG